MLELPPGMLELSPGDLPEEASLLSALFLSELLLSVAIECSELVLGGASCVRRRSFTLFAQLLVEELLEGARGRVSAAIVLLALANRGE